MTDNEEIWRDLNGFEDLYIVSNYGNVIAKERITWNGKCWVNRKRRKVTSHETRDGYLQIPLTIISRGKQLRYMVHRLVASTFIEAIPGKEFVNHKDGNKKNNFAGNLEWVTKSENCKHSFAIGLQCNKGQNHPKHKFSNENVINIRKRYSEGESTWKIYKDVGGSYTNIKDIVARRTWSHI